MSINIAATADIHAPRFKDLFLRSLNEIDFDPDLFILAGDVVEHNNVYSFQPIYDALINRFRDVPIVSVFGNEEYKGFERRYVEKYPKLIWLNDEYIMLDVKGVKVGLVGSRGALDQPTRWQAMNMPGIVEYYRGLPKKVLEMIGVLRKSGSEVVVLVSHYGLTYRNLDGEPKDVWPYLASKRFEEMISLGRVDLAIHGHVHKGLKDVVFINGVPVYNVSLPARGRVVQINLSNKAQKVGLEKWVKTGV